MNSKKTGVFISELRKGLGLTQIALAEKLSVSNRAVSKWENGDGFPDVTILPILAEALGVTVDELLAGEKNQVEKIEARFIVKGRESENDLKEGYEAFVKSRLNLPWLFSFPAFLIVFVATIMLLDLPNKFLMVIPSIFFFLVIMLMFFVMPRAGARLLIQDRKAMHNGNEDTQIEFGDKIYITTSFANQVIEYNAISKMLETKNLIVIACGRGHFLSVNKSELIKGSLDDFREFIKGKVVPNKREVMRKKFIIVSSILLFAMSIALIPLDIILYNIQSEQYQPSQIEKRAELFYDNRKEFDRAIEQLMADEEIKENVEENEYYCDSPKNYIAIDDICNVEVGKEYITLSTYDSNECFSGYAYVESNSPPYPYQIGFDHADIENYGFNYVSEDDLYLLGKEKNDKSSTSNWYLVKMLDNNWYYYEYY